MGAISGGALRPGSIDQATFVQMLQQQQQAQQNRQAAGVGGKAVPMPIQNFQSAPKIPTLSSAQFAALVGGARNANPGLAPAEGPPAMDPQAVAAAQAQAQTQARAAPMGPALKLSGSSTRNASAPAQTAGLPLTGNAGGDDADKPTITRKSQPQQMAALEGSAASSDDVPTITRKSAPSAEAVADARAEEKPAAREEETASKSDSNVVHLKSPPDKDQQKELRMRNKRWVVDETPGSRQLFFGADGEFGWDDFVDMINPLQHIPGIAQIYRAVTGDEINGAASLLGAIPFGPLGGVGLIASVADLAVKDTTGRDIGGNLVAMVFGKEDTPTAVPADMAQAPADGAAPNDEPGNAKATIQTATVEDHYAMSAASELHSSCRG